MVFLKWLCQKARKASGTTHSVFANGMSLFWQRSSTFSLAYYSPFFLFFFSIFFNSSFLFYFYFFTWLAGTFLGKKIKGKKKWGYILNLHGTRFQLITAYTLLSFIGKIFYSTLPSFYFCFPVLSLTRNAIYIYDEGTLWFSRPPHPPHSLSSLKLTWDGNFWSNANSASKFLERRVSPSDKNFEFKNNFLLRQFPYERKRSYGIAKEISFWRDFSERIFFFFFMLI